MQTSHQVMTQFCNRNYYVKRLVQLSDNFIVTKLGILPLNNNYCNGENKTRSPCLSFHFNFVVISQSSSNELNSIFIRFPFRIHANFAPRSQKVSPETSAYGPNHDFDIGDAARTIHDASFIVCLRYNWNHKNCNISQRQVRKWCGAKRQKLDLALKLRLSFIHFSATSDGNNAMCKHSGICNTFL